MGLIPTGDIGHYYCDGDEILNKPNENMLPTILLSAKTHQKHADHFLRVGAIHGDATLIIKGHLHSIVSRTLCNVLRLYDFNSTELGELVKGTKESLDETSCINEFNETIKTIIKFSSLVNNNE